LVAIDLLQMLCNGIAPPAVLRRTLQAVTGALDRLLPPQPLNRELELPSEWFKYPPI
jgi:hypothetical protein